MINLSGQVRAGLYNRLAASFNTKLAEAARQFSIQPFTIDFASAPKSPNFFFGQLDPDDIEDSSVFKYPLMTVYTLQSADKNSPKPATFGGAIRGHVDIHLSWRGGNATIDFEALGDALEAVMWSIFKDPTAQNWGLNIGLAQMGLDRGPHRFGAENWRQLLRFTFLFEVVG